MGDLYGSCDGILYGRKLYGRSPTKSPIQSPILISRSNLPSLQENYTSNLVSIQLVAQSDISLHLPSTRKRINFHNRTNR